VKAFTTLQAAYCTWMLELAASRKGSRVPSRNSTDRQSWALALSMAQVMIG
jgi:hypothetical protein